MAVLGNTCLQAGRLGICFAVMGAYLEVDAYLGLQLEGVCLVECWEVSALGCTFGFSGLLGVHLETVMYLSVSFEVGVVLGVLLKVRGAVFIGGGGSWCLLWEPDGYQWE